MAETTPELIDPALEWQQACVARARSGDRDAFIELYRFFAPTLYARILMPQLSHAQAAEDALTDTFRSLLAQLHELEGSARSLWPWLVRVAREKALDQSLSPDLARRALLNSRALHAPLMAATEVERETEGDQDDMASRAELEQRALEVMQRLPERQSHALRLRFVEARRRAQCAALMQVRESTFDVFLLRALRAFSHAWKERAADTATAQVAP
jgi:RNA polymerase sigma factor (sigma-70 family)